MVTSSSNPALEAPGAPKLSDNPVLSVSDLTLQIKGLLERQYKRIFVRGEISNFKAQSSGHFYFTLKDDNATIPVAMFRGANRALKFRPENGHEVIVMGRLSVYPPHGKYQIIAEGLEPAGVGALQRAFEQLKTKLAAEGLFEAARKRTIPKMPSKIAMVTSPTGAAIRDMLHVTRRRFANIEIVIVPVRVQGEGAAKEIAQAIRDLNAHFPDIDAMIVGRGGGSIEDLWAFNEEVVARAISESVIPIISAVGHEVDFTIADFVADLRAPTPSAAAEVIVQDKAEILRHLDHLRQRLVSPMRVVDERRQRLDQVFERLRRAKEKRLQGLERQLERLRHQVSSLSPVVRIQSWRQRLESIFPRLLRRLEGKLETTLRRFQTDSAKLDSLSPLAILSRGYSITRDAKRDRIVACVQDVKPGDLLETRLSDGTVQSTVISS